MKLWTACVVVALIAGLALAGCGKKEGSGSVGVDQSSAKAALETIAQAFKKHDGEAITKLLPPDFRESMGPAMVGLMDVATKAESLKKTLEGKFGKDVADKALKGSEGMANGGPLEGGLNEDGSIDWKKVKLTESGDTATVEIEGKSKKESLKKIDGKWCMSPPEKMTPEKAKKEGEMGKKMAKAMGDVFENVEKQVKDGKVTKDDVEKVINDAMMKAMTEAMKDAGPAN